MRANPPPVLLIWATNLKPWPEQYLRRALGCLPTFMAGEAAGFLRWQDRQARLQGRLLLRAGLARLGLPANLDAWTRGENGKPRLAGGPARFNISHTAGLTVCALALGYPLGVDVERLQPLDPGELAGFFAPEELAAIAAAADRQRELFRLWTTKEAVLKAAGVGMMKQPETVTVLGEPVELKGRRWWTAPVDLGPEHMCHLAGPQGPPTVELCQLQSAELLAHQG